MPKFALQYDFPKNLGNVYATVSKGYRSGGYNIQMFSDLLQASLKNDMMRLTKDEIMSQVPENLKDMVNFIPDAGETRMPGLPPYNKPEQTWNYEIGTHLNLFQTVCVPMPPCSGLKRATSRFPASPRADLDARR